MNHDVLERVERKLGRYLTYGDRLIVRLMETCIDIYTWRYRYIDIYRWRYGYIDT